MHNLLHMCTMDMHNFVQNACAKYILCIMCTGAEWVSTYSQWTDVYIFTMDVHNYTWTYKCAHVNNWCTQWMWTRAQWIALSHHWWAHLHNGCAHVRGTEICTEVYRVVRKIALLKISIKNNEWAKMTKWIQPIQQYNWQTSSPSHLIQFHTF